MTEMSDSELCKDYQALINYNVNPLRSENVLLDMFMEAALNGTFIEEISDFNFWWGYIQGILPQTLPSLIVGVLLLVAFPLFICARCCAYRKCCAPRRAPEEYTNCSKYTPFGFYWFGIAGSLSLAILGATYIMNTSDSVNGVNCQMDLLIADTIKFVDNMTTPLELLKLSLDNSVSQMSAVISNQVILTPFSTYLYDNLTLMASLMDNYTLADPDVFPSPNGINSASLLALRNNLESQITTTTQEAANMKSSYQSQLVARQATITSEIDAGIQMAVDMNQSLVGDMFSPLDNSLTKAANYTRQYKPMVYLLYVFIFLGTITAILVTVFLITKKVGPGRGSNTATWVFFYLFAILGFILGGVLVPSSYAYSDVCTILYTMPDNFTLYMSSFIDISVIGTAGLIVNSCFESPAPNVLPLLHVVDGINMTELTSFNSYNYSFDLSAVNTLNAQIEGLTITDFVNYGLYSPQVPSGMSATAALTQLNSLTGGAYTELDCTASADNTKTMVASTTCAPDSDSGTWNPANIPDIYVFRNATIDIILGTNTMQSLQSYDTMVNASTNDLNAKLQEYTDNMNDLKLLTIPLVYQFNQLESDMGNCAFLNEQYDQFYMLLCGQTFDNLFFFVMVLIGAAATSLIVIVCSVFVEIRIFGNRASPSIIAGRVLDGEVTHGSTIQYVEAPDVDYEAGHQAYVSYDSAKF